MPLGMSMVDSKRVFVMAHRSMPEAPFKRGWLEGRAYARASYFRVVFRIPCICTDSLQHLGLLCGARRHVSRN